VKSRIAFSLAGVLVAWIALYGQSTVTYQLAGLSTIGVEGFGGRLVEGKPFSATEERHTLQILGDGTRIENSETNRLFRDSQGRTRVERASGKIGIVDLVAGFSAELDPAARIAAVNPGESLALNSARRAALNAKIESDRRLLNTAQSVPAEAERLKAEIAKYEKEMAELTTSINRFYSTTQTAGRGGRGSAEPSGLPSQTSTFRFAIGRSEPRSEGPVLLRIDGEKTALVESLPAQSINGVMSQGSRTTETIPVGKIGNDRPISVVNERWFSNDLQMLVKSTTSDPRFGDTTYQLTNIVQTAPDPSLFQIPAEYTIRK